MAACETDTYDGEFTLKNQMLDGLLAPANIDGRFLDVQQRRLNASRRVQAGEFCFNLGRDLRGNGFD